MTAQRFTATFQVLHLKRVFFWTIERQRLKLFIIEWQIKTITEINKRLLIKFLDLVRFIHRLRLRREPIAFDCFDQNNCWLTFGLHGLTKGSIDLHWVMTTTVQTRDVMVRQLIGHLFKLWVFPKELFTHKARIACLIQLVLTIDHFFHTVLEHTCHVFIKQCIPVTTPDDFNHAPACTAKYRLQLLNNLAITTHRAIEALQVTVDDPNQVIQLFAASK